MMKAAMLECGVETIDHLVTGLPSSQAHEQKLCAAIQEKFSGTLQLTPKISVDVKRVTYVPQPSGTIANIQAVGDDELYELICQGKTIVVDPGFFSVDWIMMVAGKYHKSTTDSSLKAVSNLLELVGELIKTDYGTAPSISTLESTIRNGRKNVLVFGKKVELAPYVRRAQQTMAAKALTPMRQRFREVGLDADLVLVTGGGNTMYLEEIASLFPNSRIVYFSKEAPQNIMKDDQWLSRLERLESCSVTANVEGYWFMAAA